MAVIPPASLSKIVNEFGGSGNHELSEYFRGNAWIPSHYHNESISTGTSGLSISQFSNSSKNYYGTVTVGNNGGGYNLGRYGFDTTAGGGPNFFGTITNSRYGITRIGTSYSDIAEISEVGLFNGLFVYWIFSFGIYGYHTYSLRPFVSITVNGLTFAAADAFNPDGIYDGSPNGYYTAWEWISGAAARAFPTSGDWSIDIEYGGP